MYILTARCDWLHTCNIRDNCSHSTFCSRTKKRHQLVLWGLEPWLAPLVLSVQNCCNFTVAVPLLGFTESPNSTPSTGRQLPSHQQHGIRGGNWPIASPWGHRAGHLTWPVAHTHTPPHYYCQGRAHCPRSSVGWQRWSSEETAVDLVGVVWL